MINQKVELFVSVITSASIIVILIPYIFSLSDYLMQLIYLFDFFVVAILAIDFYRRLRNSKERPAKFILNHWYEIPAMIPFVFFAVIPEQGKQTFLGASTRSFRLVGLFMILYLFFRTLKTFEGRRLLYIIIFSSMAISFGAICEYLVESPNPGANITTIGEAFWWAISTVTTVGYGDVYPVTAAGKIIASLLMFVGIAILGILISTLGAALIESRLNKQKKESKSDLTQQTKILIKNKIDEIDTLEQKEFDNLILTIIHLRDIVYKEE